MQRNLWMRPAYQKCEAVLLPALPRWYMNETRISNGSSYVKPPEDPFRPMPPIEGLCPVQSLLQQQSANLALSTYVRPRGSMCGRSVLRAAGMARDPYAMRAKPRYQPQRAYTAAKTNQWNSWM